VPCATLYARSRRGRTLCVEVVGGDMLCVVVLEVVGQPRMSKVVWRGGENSCAATCKQGVAPRLWRKQKMSAKNPAKVTVMTAQNRWHFSTPTF